MKEKTLTPLSYSNAYVGHGKLVHIVLGDNPLCGSGMRSGVHNFHHPAVRMTTDSVTCKKCKYNLGEKQG